MIASGWLWIALVATGCGSVLSTLYLCLRDLSRVKLEEKAAALERATVITRVAHIMSDLSGHANALLLPRIMCNLVVAVAMVLWILAVKGSVTPGWMEPALAVLASGIAILIFGAVIPQSVANHVPEQTVLAWSVPIRWIYAVMWPVRTMASFMDEVVRRLSGKTDADEAEAAQEELLSVVDEVKREGQIDETARDMIEAVVEFRSTTVEQIMTPRTEMEAIDLSTNLGDLIRVVREIGHSRIPVYEDSIDHIVGVFYVKDLMRWLAGEHQPQHGFNFREILRPAIFVPETKTVRELLRELLAKKVHIAIVADEFGGTAGLVTIEDIVEEVFGEIQDEYEVGLDGPTPTTVDHDTGAAEIDARTYIDDANDALAPLGVEFPESEDYDTVGGFVTVTLGRIPAAGERVALGDFSIEIIDAEPTRVSKIRVKAERPASIEPRDADEEAESAEPARD
jgi:putative hemolysin